MMISGARSTGSVMTGTPAHIGSSSVMCADTGTKPSFRFTQQNAASIAPASDNPWPVRLFVELTSGRFPSGNTLLMALTIHTGGPSIPGSGLIDKDVVLEADADIIGHINGGHTSLSEAHVCELCEKSSRAIEIVHNGNEKVAIAAAQAALQLKCPHRVILGTDGPAGSGVQPLGILRMIALLSSFANIPAELVFCFATGNTARIRNLNCGLIEPGRAADFVFMDRAQHTAAATLLDSVHLGDVPGIGMVMIDGIVRCYRSRNTPPATEVPVIVGLH